MQIIYVLPKIYWFRAETLHVQLHLNILCFLIFRECFRSNSLNETLGIRVKIRSSFWSVLSPTMGKSGPEKSVFGHFSHSENNRNDKVYVLFVKLFWQKQLSWKNSCSAKNTAHLFCMASKLLKSDKLHLFLLSDVRVTLYCRFFSMLNSIKPKSWNKSCSNVAV